MTLTALLLGGCATMATLSADRVEGTIYEDDHVPRSLPRVFSGTVVDSWCTYDTFRSPPGAAQAGFFCMLDVPFSLALDAIVLPYTAYTQLRYGNYHSRLIPQLHEEMRRIREASRRQLIADCRQSVEAGFGEYASCFGVLKDAGEIAWPPVDPDRIELPP